ncbi:MAG: hypothetical protein NT129_05815 [Candidatus Aenigmarchaeota archaeon]|nr:hypothetical protein [Candidatus Aenigmarchaeota archaeon]
MTFTDQRDEQKKKAFDVKEYGEESVYYWLPELSLFRYELGKEVIKDSDAYTPEEGLKLNKFFASDDGEKFKNASAVEKWLDILARKDERLGASPFNNNKLANKLDHTFWILPDVNSVKAMRRMLDNHYFFKRIFQRINSSKSTF